MRLMPVGITMSKKNKIELNDRFRHALRVIEESNSNVFITGRAGTGKSTLLEYFRDTTAKNIAVLAPTGVAAVNVKGQTVHSFFNFRPDVTPDTAGKIRPKDKDIYKKLDAIVIDEISMVRADILDSVDVFLKRYGKKKGHPFGGIQMIFIGDLYQLPPVVPSREKALFSGHYKSPYFFSARVFDEDLFSTISASFDMEFIELEKVYRQKDKKFHNVLNSIRNNTVSDEEIKEMNRKYDPDFIEGTDDLHIYLTTTNAMAEAINMERLSKIKKDEYGYKGIIDGDFGKKNLPTSLDLSLKEGSQVMLLNNDSLGRWINGSIGTVSEIEEVDDGPDILWVELASGDLVDVLPHKWEMYEFSYDKEASKIFSESVGSFAQYPIRLAWAVTIHKSQGMTFNRAIIDIGRGTFSHGQLYVALSRCTSIDGIVLKRPVHRRNVLLDQRVVSFVTEYQYRQAKKLFSIEDRFTLLDRAIKEKKKIEIVYLKIKDEKSKRTVIPIEAGAMNYQGRKFQGLRAICTDKNDERVFHIDRILEMKIV